MLKLLHSGISQAIFQRRLKRVKKIMWFFILKQPKIPDLQDEDYMRPGHLNRRMLIPSQVQVNIRLWQNFKKSYRNNNICTKLIQYTKYLYHTIYSILFVRLRLVLEDFLRFCLNFRHKFIWQHTWLGLDYNTRR